MSSFPLLKLPYVAQIHVLKVIDADDLLVFSFISKRSKNLAISARRIVEDIKWTLSSHYKCNFLSYSRVHEVKFGMEEQLREEARQRGSLEFWKLNGQLIPVYRKNDRKYWVPWTWYIGEHIDMDEENEEILIQYSEHILEVFQCQDFHYTTANPDPIEDLFVMRHTRDFKLLEISNFYEFPAEDLKFILEELEIERFAISRKVPDFQWNGPLRVEDLSVHQAGWLAFEAILKLDCRSVDLTYHTLTDDQFNRYIKTWLDGGLENLEFINVLCENLQSSEAVLQGIQTIPYHPDRHPEKHPIDAGDLYKFQEFSVDVQRSDGVVATILVVPDEAIFILAVWDE